MTGAIVDMNANATSATVELLGDTRSSQVAVAGCSMAPVPAMSALCI